MPPQSPLQAGARVPPPRSRQAAAAATHHQPPVYHQHGGGSAYTAAPMMMDNRFDADEGYPMYAPPPQHHRHHRHHNLVPATAGSADTSISSVATEPHPHDVSLEGAPEPSQRRRVPSPLSCAAAGVPRGSFDHVPQQQQHQGRQLSPTSPSQHDRSTGGTSPLRRSHNPYLYNVLGGNASPDMAARTSPIPPDDSGVLSVFDVTASTVVGAATAVGGRGGGGGMPGRNLSFVDEWGDDDRANRSSTFEMNTTTAPATPLMGGYMAQCYSSAFPPGCLPAMPGPAEPMIAAEAPVRTSPPPPRSSNPTRRRTSAAGRDAAPFPERGAPASVSKAASSSPPPPLSAATVDSRNVSPTSPTSPTMTRVYRNGRPVPVPTAVRNQSPPATAVSVA